MLRSGLIARIILGSLGWTMAADAGGGLPGATAVHYQLPFGQLVALASLMSPTKAELRSRRSVAKMERRRLVRGLASSKLPASCSMSSPLLKCHHSQRKASLLQTERTGL